MKKKKGFTLVELLVVIAILAVLATVSVVGYMGFTKKAKESNDASLTAQMNTALQANGVVKKNKTLTEAREDLLEAGIDLEKVTPTTDGYSYVWDSKQDLMFLLNENRDVVAPTNATISANTVDSFVVIHNEAEFNTWKDFNYSLYFANGYESQTLTLTKLVGIDAGTSGINNISVKDDSSTADVTMYTTSGTLTIDARQATVRHYGEVKTVSIKAIAGNSYHEYGTVTGNVEVTKGRVELENTADVNTVLVSSETSGDSKVDYNSGAKVGTVAPTTDAAKADVSSSTIPSESKQETVVDTTETSKFAGGLGTEKSPYLISNTSEWKNIVEVGVAESGKYFKVISDLDFTGVENISIYSFVGNLDFDSHTVKGVNEINTWNGYGYLIAYAGNENYETKISNLNFEVNGYASLVFVGYYAKKLTLENITTTGSVEISGDNNYSPFISRLISKNDAVCNFTMINCVNNTNITSDACTGVFVGKVSEDSTCSSAKISFINCVNNGTVIRTNGIAAMFFANACTFANQKVEDINIVKCVNNGFIAGTKKARFIAADYKLAWNEEKENEFVSKLGNNLINGNINGLGKINTGILNVNDGKFVLPIIEGASRYTFSFNIWNSAYKDEQLINWGSESIVFKINSSEISNANILAQKFIQYDYSENSSQKVVEHDDFGTKYYTCGNNYVYIIDLKSYGDCDYATIALQPKVSFVAYNDAGIPLAVYAYDLNKLA